MSRVRVLLPVSLPTGVDEVVLTHDESRPVQVLLQHDTFVSVVTPNGDAIRVHVQQDADGGTFLLLEGGNCDLAGEQPGLYYPTIRP